MSSLPSQNAEESEKQWFVMRDLKRRNAKLPAYKLLDSLNVTCFTPMVERLLKVDGRRVRQKVPFMQDLLFVNDTRCRLDGIVEKTSTLQYRYVIGARQTPMTVRNADMEHFIRAVMSTEFPQYFTPDEVTTAMRNRRIRIIGGALDGYEGTLVTTRGSKVKRLLVEIPMLLAAAVEVSPEYIQVL